MKFCKVHHFADDTSLLCLSNSIKKLKKAVNADLKHLANWLNVNKISLNAKKKTEMVILKSKQKKFEGDLKIKLCGKTLYPTERVKYLGVKTDTNLLTNPSFILKFSTTRFRHVSSYYLVIFNTDEQFLFYNFIMILKGNKLTRLNKLT